MVDVTVEGLDMTYKVGQATAKARLDAWMTPAHDLGPYRIYLGRSKSVCVNDIATMCSQ